MEGGSAGSLTVCDGYVTVCDCAAGAGADGEQRAVEMTQSASGGIVDDLAAIAVSYDNSMEL